MASAERKAVKKTYEQRFRPEWLHQKDFEDGWANKTEQGAKVCRMQQECAMPPICLAQTLQYTNARK